MRLVGSVRDGRFVDRDLRIGICRSEQERRNLEKAARCKKQEVRRCNHRFCLPAILRSAWSDSDHIVPARPRRRPLGNERLIFSE